MEQFMIFFLDCRIILAYDLKEIETIRGITYHVILKYEKISYYDGTMWIALESLYKYTV